MRELSKVQDKKQGQQLNGNIVDPMTNSQNLGKVAARAFTFGPTLSTIMKTTSRTARWCFCC